MRKRDRKVQLAMNCAAAKPAVDFNQPLAWFVNLIIF